MGFGGQKCNPFVTKGRTKISETNGMYGDYESLSLEDACSEI